MIPELPESPTLSRQRRVTMGETNDEREGSRAAHPPPRLYPESPFPEAFCFLFFRSTKRRILLPRYREGKMDLLHSDDCLVCFSAFSSQMSSLVFFGFFLGLFLSDFGFRFWFGSTKRWRRMLGTTSLALAFRVPPYEPMIATISFSSTSLYRERPGRD
jgi:hypothetical protein